MFCLGIESTAHTLGIGIAQYTGSTGKKAAGAQGRLHKSKPIPIKPGHLSILSNCLDMYRPVREGIVPRKAADHHQQVFSDILCGALDKAGVKLGEIDLFAFSRGPGIGQCLRVSCAGAKYLAAKCGKPIIGVNHCQAHLAVSKWHCGFVDPLYLYVSGGNTQIIKEIGGHVADGRANPACGFGASCYQVLGETLDIGIGNLFDGFGRAMGLKHAHGSAVAKAAEGGKYVELPYTVKGTNMAFSGLLTASQKLLARHSKKDVAYSLMETAFAVVCEATERAAYLEKKRELVVCGGVAQNLRLCSMLESLCAQNNWKFGVASPELNRDNGAMIALTGLKNHLEGERLPMKGAKPDQNWRIDSS
ncbi:tRNA (adenosine(37)-N6)-threonylcarbamoyltransferase complex transferase subunit TsaD [Candidatus Parvarchaeota archaeon]|nr:tRNA (adenosine(37)-N6)-threonylcarbamoyltransferase complex transferase subunit TsaD [Candidatus Parvarchaeota archaeon]